MLSYSLVGNLDFAIQAIDDRIVNKKVTITPAEKNTTFRLSLRQARSLNGWLAIARQLLNNDTP